MPSSTRDLCGIASIFIPMEVQTMTRPQRRTKRNMMKPMSDRKLQVLKLLATYPFDRRQVATGPVISKLLKWCREDATPVLNRLGADGLTEKSSVRAHGAFIWNITEKGRDAYFATIADQDKAA